MKKKLEAFPKYKRRGKRQKGRVVDKKHRERLAWMPCLCCHAVTGNPPHHLLRTGEHGAGLKSGDQWCVPLCDFHHKRLHANGDEVIFFSTFGLDHNWVKEVAQNLWKESHGTK